MTRWAEKLRTRAAELRRAQPAPPPEPPAAAAGGGPPPVSPSSPGPPVAPPETKGDHRSQALALAAPPPEQAPALPVALPLSDAGSFLAAHEEWDRLVTWFLAADLPAGDLALTRDGLRKLLREGPLTPVWRPTLQTLRRLAKEHGGPTA